MEENRIYLGDAYDLIKGIPDKSIDLIVTDPPYEIGNLTAKAHGLYSKGGATRKYERQMLEKGIHKGIDLSILNEFVRVMKRINIYLWCNKEQIYDYMSFFAKEKGCNFEFIIWAKSNPPPFTYGHYLKDKEYCIYFWEKGVKPKIDYGRGKTVYFSSLNTYDKERFSHPTIKPVEIIENLIANSSDEGDLILDPFVGSGTTALACKHLKRKYIAFEIDEEFHQIAVDRLQGWNARGEFDLTEL